MALFLCTPLFAQEIKLDLQKIDPDLARQIIAAQQKADKQVEVTPAKVQEWAEIGKAVGSVVKDTAKTLNVESNSFAQSPLGRTIVWLVVYNYIGKGWIKAGLFFFLFLMLLMITLYVWFTKREFENKEDYAVAMLIGTAASLVVFVISVLII